MEITFRPALPEDDAFLFRVYSSTREAEFSVLNLPPEFLEHLIRQQFEAQRTAYAAQFSNLAQLVILCDNLPVGRMLLDYGPTDIHLADIALLPEQRGKGIGNWIMADLLQQARANHQTVSLFADTDSRPFFWYQKLGFTIIKTDSVYTEMIWRPNAQN
ncbi:MAG: GNAT family N-acetyltransferase [Blastocatellia bacterium]|nr:GNAT family N-acetyltransferase [Blastocatellia bacterium]